MKKSIVALAMASAMTAANASSESDLNLGVGLNYGLFSGPSLELTYPINNTFQLRGAISGGMSIDESENGDTEEEIDYAVESDGSIHRIAIDYHPFEGTFFLSAGYAINSFALNTTGSKDAGSTVEIGNDEYSVTEDLAIKGAFDWDSGPTLSFGWGHSPAEGLGLMFEVGAIFTGAPGVKLTASGAVDGQDVNDNQDVQDSLDEEENQLKDDVADFEILPIVQLGITYRF